MTPIRQSKAVTVQSMPTIRLSMVVFVQSMLEMVRSMPIAHIDQRSSSTDHQSRHLEKAFDFGAILAKSADSADLNQIRRYPVENWRRIG